MAKQKISIVRGTTNTFAVAIEDEDGELYELESGEVLRFGIKRRAEDDEYIFELEATSSDADTDGAYPFALGPTDTIELPFGTYIYDVGLQSGDDYYNIIPPSDFVISKNVTSWEVI